MSYDVAGQWGDVPIIDVQSALEIDGIDSASFAGRANMFVCPRGAEVGYATVLMAESDVQNVKSGNSADLTFALTPNSGEKPEKVTFKSLSFLSANRILVNGTQAQDGNSLCLVTLVDARWKLSQRGYINTRFNARYPGAASGAYVTGTLASGNVPWTWQAAVQSLATALGLATLTLPTISPAISSVPENLIYQGSPWQALNDLLLRCGCALRLNPFDSSWTVVTIGGGAADTSPSPIQFDATQGGPQTPGDFKAVAGPSTGDWILSDDEYWLGNVAIPNVVTVLFPNKFIYTGQYLQSGEYFSVDVQTSSLNLGSRYTAAAQAASGGSNRYTARDAMFALYTTGGTTPDNLAALQSRAAEVATRYIRILMDNLHGSIVKSGLFKCYPDQYITRVTWGMTGGEFGMRTQIDRDPPDPQPLPWTPPQACPNLQGVCGEILPAKAFGMHPTTSTLWIIGNNPFSFVLGISGGTPTSGNITLRVGTQTVALPYDVGGDIAANMIAALPNVASATSADFGQLPGFPISVNVVFNAGETDTTLAVNSSSLNGGGTADFLSGFGYVGKCTITNRSQSIAVAAGTYCICADTGTEVNPVFVDCPPD